MMLIVSLVEFAIPKTRMWQTHNAQLTNFEVASLRVSASATATSPSGLRKFGPIVGDTAEIGCNAAINRGSVIGRDCMIYLTTNFRGVLPNDTMVKLRQELQVLEKRKS
jgi:UDP-3-O-[3-hydroxymyristoyl] glucosamine N-acyltransferase